MAFKKNNVLKLSTLFLVMLLSFSLFNFYKVTSNFDNFKENSSAESKLKQSQLDEILVKYDSLKSFAKSKDIVDLKNVQKSEEEKPAVQRGKFENSDEEEINSQIKILKNIINNDSKEVVFLEEKINSDRKTLNRLEFLRQKEVKNKANKLSVININAKGVKIITDKYARASDKIIQQLRVCFTVEGNEFIKKGEKKFYIQVVNPRNQIVSFESTFIELKDVKLIYSAKVEANYTQKDIDICTYVDLEKNKTIKGKYKINVYNEFSKIGTAIFDYN
ncbi:hypothetical protein [Flavobacterium sp.]|jgi:hypothetical protein|uniref:hypothetical protein n=1 Tax=Flavobacterium sp. TaxID=239 RepID=UPI002A813F5E|nr:hypothetical protein [Flavobacterium sp.]